MEHIGLSYLGKKKDSGVGVYEQETTTLHMTNPCLVMDTSLFYLFHIQIYLGGSTCLQLIKNNKLLFMKETDMLALCNGFGHQLL